MGPATLREIDVDSCCYAPLPRGEKRLDRLLARAISGDTILISGPIVSAEEDRQPPIAALGDMVRHIRDDDTRQAGHKRDDSATPDDRQLCIVSLELRWCPWNCVVSLELRRW